MILKKRVHMREPIGDWTESVMKDIGNRLLRKCQRNELLDLTIMRVVPNDSRLHDFIEFEIEVGEKTQVGKSKRLIKVLDLLQEERVFFSI